MESPCWGRLRYFDTRYEREAVKILPGEYHVSSAPVVLLTVLGSCVTVCLHDPVVGVGGMNHFMLPRDGPAGAARDAAGRYGTHAMELLINGLLKAGAVRSRFQAKVFGGGAVLAGLSGTAIGRHNIDFVRAYLTAEGIGIVAEDLGGASARKVVYFPDSGRALVRTLRAVDARDEVAHEAVYQSRLRQSPPAGEVELFG